jgi:hypothetical protein
MLNSFRIQDSGFRIQDSGSGREERNGISPIVERTFKDAETLSHPKPQFTPNNFRLDPEISGET